MPKTSSTQESAMPHDSRSSTGLGMPNIWINGRPVARFDEIQDVLDDRGHFAGNSGLGVGSRFRF